MPRRCGKRIFWSELNAKMAVTFAGAKHDRLNRDKCEQRYYWCNRCRGFHITSQPKVWASTQSDEVVDLTPQEQM